MSCLLGIDLGTSSVRALILDQNGRLIGSAAEKYPILSPQQEFAEQDPDLWWEKTTRAIRAAIAAGGIEAGRIAGIGLSGQMHGTVVVDSEKNHLRPAVIWPDRRSREECQRLTDALGKERLYRLTGLPTAVGFTAPTVSWLKRNEADTMRRAAAILLPKDYIRLKLTGRLSSEPSDASGSFFFDVVKRRWSPEIIAAVGIEPGLLPDLIDSGQVAGTTSRFAARECGLVAGTPVIAGGSDQAMAAIGSGAVESGIVISSLGTGGQLVTCVAEPLMDPGRRLHTLCHAVADRWLLMGAILSAGLSLQWFDGIIGRAGPTPEDEEMRRRFAELDEEAQGIPPGSEGLLFLPYLCGERTPHLDPLARGAFIGLTLRHTRGHMIRSIMEGVSFAMKQSLEIFNSLDVEVQLLVAAGGGARSGLWRQIQADIYEQPLTTIDVEEHSATGAALLAGVGVGVFPDLAAACRKCIRFDEKNVTVPTEDDDQLGRYRELFDVYGSLYPRLKDVYHALPGAPGIHG